jgi:hypothetical protein
LSDTLSWRVCQFKWVGSFYYHIETAILGTLADISLAILSFRYVFLLSAHTRRCLTQQFPFGVIYQVLTDRILIVAVAHLNRKPDYWLNRVEEK